MASKKVGTTKRATPKAVRALASAPRRGKKQGAASSGPPKASAANTKSGPPKASAANTKSGPPKASAPSAKSKAAGERKRPSRAGSPDVGDPAPSFVLQDETGSVVSSESLRGTPYVLYFYPRDDTPGCTLEACGFRDSLSRFNAKGVRVVGVSADSPESHRRFREKYGLDFQLLSDQEKTLARAYGVWVKKQNYGREYMGIERSTFVVDRRGRIKSVWRGVRVPGHVQSVLDSV